MIGDESGRKRLHQFLEYTLGITRLQPTQLARCGCPPEHWGHGLQVLIENIAGVVLVTKLRAILSMEGDFNYMNKWIFGHGAINEL
jgi:hypothetical protein